MPEKVVKEVHLRGEFLAPRKLNRVAVLLRENDDEIVHIIELSESEQRAWDRNDPVISGRVIGTYVNVIKIQTGKKAAA
jgi:hypothetical protein